MFNSCLKLNGIFPGLFQEIEALIQTVFVKQTETDNQSVKQTERQIDRHKHISLSTSMF